MNFESYASQVDNLPSKIRSGSARDGLQMPLGFSLGEVVATMGFVAVSFGAKEIPFLARSLGRLAGHAVGELDVPNLSFECTKPAPRANFNSRIC